MALSIEYEKADQRRYYRVTAPLFVTLKKKQYRAVDWSIGGLRLEGITSKLPAIGERVKVEITLPYQDFRISFEAELEIVRHVEDKDGFGAKFIGLGEREQGLMTHFIDEIVRGSMVDVKETIARMDVPLTPVSMQPETPDESANEKTTRQRWTSSPWLVSAFYGLMGLLVFGYTAFVAYTNIFHLVVETAVVGGRVGILKAQSDGEIVYKSVKIGQRVEPGEIIGRIDDPVLAARIEKAAIEIKRKQAEQIFLQQQTGAASNRSKEILTQKSGSLKNQKQRVRSLGIQVRKARIKYDRLSRALRRRRAKKQRVNNARANLARLRSRLAKARSVLKGREKIVKGSGYIDVSGGQLVISSDPLYRARLELIRNEIELARQDHQTLIKLRDDRVIKAPYAARIVDLPKYSSSTVIKGDVVVVFEAAASNAVTAYLTQEEILKVKIGDKASVFIPALDQSVGARIKAINRRFSFVSEKDQSYTWRPKEERNAQVVLEILPGDQAIADQLTTGLPAVIMFKDREPNYLLSYILPGFFKSKT